jgi:hypothetical protein
MNQNGNPPKCFSHVRSVELEAKLRSAATTEKVRPKLTKQVSNIKQVGEIKVFSKEQFNFLLTLQYMEQRT